MFSRKNCKFSRDRQARVEVRKQISDKEPAVEVVFVLPVSLLFS